MKKLVCVKVYSNRIEAEMAKGLLESQGIKSIIRADDAGGMRPDLLWARGGAKLLVCAKDEGTAREILENE